MIIFQPLNKYKLFTSAVRKITAVLIALVYLFSCKPTAHHEIIPSFYYWKSVLALNSFEQSRIKDLHIQNLYIKCFDVDWNEITHQAVPKAKLQVDHQPISDSLHIIPTVFITNECIQQIDSSAVKELAAKIHQLMQDMITAYHFKFVDEIQMDCDWTPSTKEKYFLLLRFLNQQTFTVNNQNITPVLSCTIRLHQVKFLSKTGVPPVDRGLLMCYNMGNLKNPDAPNSILDVNELKQYTGHLDTYPLPLDVGLPLFSWNVLFKNNIYAGLIENFSVSALKPSFTSRKLNRYTFLTDTVLQGYTFFKGDVLRNETCDMDALLQVTSLIGSRLKNTRIKVALYHLDSVILNKYSLHELEALYNGLR